MGKWTANKNKNLSLEESLELASLNKLLTEDTNEKITSRIKNKGKSKK